MSVAIDRRSGDRSNHGLSLYASVRSCDAAGRGEEFEESLDTECACVRARSVTVATASRRVAQGMERHDHGGEVGKVGPETSVRVRA